MAMDKTRGLTFIGAVAVVCGLLVVGSFLADGQAMRHEMLEKGIDASGLDRQHWYLSGAGPDDARRPLTWRDVIRSNYPTEPNFDPSEEELYRKNPLSFLRVVRPNNSMSMLARGPDAPSSLDRAKDRWYMAGQYDDHARELHGRVPQIGRYVQAGYPSDYASPSSFPLGAPEKEKVGGRTAHFVRLAAAAPHRTPLTACSVLCPGAARRTRATAAALGRTREPVNKIIAVGESSRQRDC
jgi:hypothetical protein